MTLEAESAKVGISGVVGGFLGWLMSYLTKKELMPKGQCDERHKAVDDWRHETNERFDRVEKKIDDIKDLILKGK